MRKHKFLLVSLSVFILLGIVVSAFAVNNGKKPDSSQGKWENPIADRIAMTLENTEFTIKKSSQDSEKYVLTLYLTLNKTQGDFYGRINSFSFSGMAYDSIVYTALTKEAENKTLDNLVLTSTDGQPDIYKWKIDITMNILGKGTYNPTVKIDFASGMSEKMITEKFIEIPVKVTVE